MNITILKHASLSALVAATIIFPVASAHGNGYVMDSSGKPVSTGAGSCLHSGSGNMFEDCGSKAVIPKPVKAAAPVKHPKPQVVKAIPEPKPAPVKIQVLNLNESGGANFASGSANISKKGKSTLTSFANKILNGKVKPGSIRIVGHTDNVGSVADNKKLSIQRANAVARFLASKGLNRGIMKVSGQGESRPVANNKTKAGRAQNRRVAITVKGSSHATLQY